MDPRGQIWFHKLAITSVDQVENMALTRGWQMFLQDLNHITKNKILVHEKVEESEHKTIFVAESELLVAEVVFLLLTETAFDHFSKDFGFVAEVFKQICQFAGHFKIGFFLLDHVFPIDFCDLRSIITIWDTLASTEQERIRAWLYWPLPYMRKIEHFPI